MNRIKSAFQEGTKYVPLLLSILITGLAYGLYKGVLDNYLAEVVHMGEMDRGVTEFFRELPGILLVFILAVFYMFSAETMYKAGALIMLVGMGMHAALPADKVLITLAICVYSLGEHIQLGMKSSITMAYAKPNKGGAALGVQSAASQIGTLAGYAAVVLVFSLVTKNQPYTLFFWLSTVLEGVGAIFAMRMTSSSAPDAAKRRFYFHRKYSKYYMLEMFYGARKQVFITFGPYVLILFYGANAVEFNLSFFLLSKVFHTKSLLFTMISVIC